MLNQVANVDQCKYADPDFQSIYVFPNISIVTGCKSQVFGKMEFPGAFWEAVYTPCLVPQGSLPGSRQLLCNM